jgi:hypothetical protein
MIGKIWIPMFSTLVGFAVLHMLTEYALIAKTSDVVHLTISEVIEPATNDFNSQIEAIGKLMLSEFETKKRIDSLVLQHQFDSAIALRGQQFEHCSPTVRNLIRNNSSLTQNGQLCSSTPENKFCGMWKQAQCDKDRSVVYVSKSGMGSSLNNIVSIAGASLFQNRTFCMGDSKGYGNLNLYFQTGPCGDFCSSNPHRVNCTFEAMRQPGVVECSNTDVYNSGIVSMLVNQVKFKNPLVKRELTESVLRFNSEISSILEGQLELSLHQYFASRGTREDCTQKKFSIGVHIRRGDKKFQTDYVPTEKYVQAVRETIANETQGSAKNFVVLIASDDQTAVQEFKDLAGDLTVVTLAKIVDTSRKGFDEKKWFSQSFHQKYIGALEFFSEIEALGRTDKLICTFSSNVCRLLLMIRKADLDTVTSLDEKWKTY